MIWLSSGDTEEVIKQFERLKSGEGNIPYDKDYIFRVVTDRDRFIEKLMIFDCGYDDRIIELMKFFAAKALEDGDSSKAPEDIYFDCSNPEGYRWLLDYPDGQSGWAEFDQGLYDFVSASWMSDVENEDSVVIDGYWAYKMIESAL